MGTCLSDQTYTDYTEYIEECCLTAGVYTLKCQDSYGDGWHGGFIEIQGTKYCDDFTSIVGVSNSILDEQNTQITIVSQGKYHFTERLMPLFIMG